MKISKRKPIIKKGFSNYFYCFYLWVWDFIFSAIGIVLSKSKNFVETLQNVLWIPYVWIAIFIAKVAFSA